MEEFSSMPFWWEIDRTIGLFYFLLGVAGAGIMIYIGEWDRLLGTSAYRLKIEENIEYLRKMLEENKGQPEFAGILDAINKEEEALYKELRRTELFGGVLYLFIGGIVAMILARELIEAVAFGAGWTGFIGTFLVKKDEEKRQEARNKKIDEDRKTIFEDFESKLKEKVADSYYRGYTDAINAIASSENKSFEDVLKNIKGNEET